MRAVNIAIKITNEKKQNAKHKYFTSWKQPQIVATFYFEMRRTAETAAVKFKVQIFNFAQCGCDVKIDL